MLTPAPIKEYREKNDDVYNNAFIEYDNLRSK